MTNSTGLADRTELPTESSIRRSSAGGDGTSARQPEKRSPLAAGLALHRGKALLAILAGTALLWSYWPVLCEMAARWAHNPRYSHGFLVPFFACYLLSTRRPERSGLVPASCPALSLFAAGAALRLFGAIFSCLGSSPSRSSFRWRASVCSWVDGRVSPELAIDCVPHFHGAVAVPHRGIARCSLAAPRYRRQRVRPASIRSARIQLGQHHRYRRFPDRSHRGVQRPRHGLYVSGLLGRRGPPGRKAVPGQCDLDRQRSSPLRLPPTSPASWRRACCTRPWEEGSPLQSITTWPDGS